ncbi:hypothetical protein [Fimbriimonas ginsengisoli]|uniref:Uncharacterized protein n=1 Tax=Fimbriimonas ginsengisoli Gsoil 348 TaxID=661478 RepID=A0A068NY98_FIMGI|nr:hypothetical protein [Fimbriimonas ginsengisoli]AIE86774.1 hypothetical protein OP10G_3406 [Fimbriimonas ginsengisoli Gsoil 348]
MSRVLLFISLLANQAPKTLAGYIDGLNWNPAKAGALVTVSPESVRASGGGVSLAAFKRKKVVVGGLTAIVPTEMVVIDDSFKQPPNLYDGLPREAKVLYLLKSLTDGQWKLATGRGIGLNDLQGEPRAVYQSILPKKMKWIAYRVGADGQLGKEEEKGELDGTATSRVRLRVSRRIQFQLQLANERGTTFHSTDEDWGSPGDLVTTRDDEEEMNRGDSFGVTVRQAIENKPKPSDIAYADVGFDPLVEVPPASTVRDLLKSIGAATGREIHADIRVAERRVTVVGNRVRSGDLLKALALGVTGAYRRVGGAYILTSDLMGLGTRKMRFATWQENLENATYTKEDEWRREIGDNVHRIGFLPDSTFVPNGTVRKQLERFDTNPSTATFSADELTPAMREFLATTNKRYAHQPVKTDRVGVASEIEYGFLLPDGRALKPERTSIGFAWSFKPPASPPRDPGRLPKSVLPLSIPAAGPAISFAVFAPTPEAAEQAVEQVRVHGIREIWLETRDPRALETAIQKGRAAGVKVQLYVRPWSSRAAAAEDPDRTILGDAGAAIDERIQKEPAWQRYFNQSQEKLTPAFETISPTDPGLPVRWNELVTLSRTPGLAGVVVADSAPNGYEPVTNRAIYAGYSRVLAHTKNLGYSTSQRLAFLRLHEIDPIDIVDEMLMSGPDLRQPFFLDDGLRGIPTVFDGGDQPHPAIPGMFRVWTEFRAKANASAIQKLLTPIAAIVPVTIEARLGVANYPRFKNRALFPWRPGMPLPETDAEAPYRIVERPGMIGYADFPDTWPLSPTDYTPLLVQYVIGNKERRVAFDASAVPPQQLPILLDHWFTRKE